MLLSDGSFENPQKSHKDVDFYSSSDPVEA